MTTVLCFYISAKYDKSDCRGYVYYGTVIVDVVGIVFTSVMLSSFL